MISLATLWTELDEATSLQFREEKEQCIAICFIVRSFPERHKILLQDLKRSENIERDECPKTLTESFDIVVRESG